MLLLLVNQISRSFSTPSKNCTLSVLLSLVVAILRWHKILFTTVLYVEANESFFLKFVFRSKCTINHSPHRTLLYYWERVNEQSYWWWFLSSSHSFACAIWWFLSFPHFLAWRPFLTIASTLNACANLSTNRSLRWTHAHFDVLCLKLYYFWFF